MLATYYPSLSDVYTTSDYPLLELALILGRARMNEWLHEVASYATLWICGDKGPFIPQRQKSSRVQLLQCPLMGGTRDCYRLCECISIFNSSQIESIIIVHI